MYYKEIRIAGFGGQGVVLAGYIMGKAACIYDNKFSTLIRSFGPEARGGTCSAQVIISEQPIGYPYVTSPDVIVALSQESCEKFLPTLKPGGTIISDEELVSVDKETLNGSVYSLPATTLAETFGRKLVMNIVILGFFSAVTGIVGLDPMRKAVLDSVPAGTKDFNVMAFEKGFASGCRILRSIKQGTPSDSSVKEIQA